MKEKNKNKFTMRDFKFSIDFDELNINLFAIEKAIKEVIYKHKNIKK